MFSCSQSTHNQQDKRKTAERQKDKLRVWLQFSWVDGFQQFVLRKVQQADGTAVAYDSNDQKQDNDDEEEEEEEEDPPKPPMRSVSLEAERRKDSELRGTAWLLEEEEEEEEGGEGGSPSEAFILL